MTSLQNGARLKGWAGPDVGYGYISNITFNGMYNYNVDWPIVLDACYFNVNAVSQAIPDMFLIILNHSSQHVQHTHPVWT
jgi:hypothetical protein